MAIKRESLVMSWLSKERRIFKPKVYGGPPKKVTRLKWVLFYCAVFAPFVLIALGTLISCEVVMVIGVVGLTPLVIAVVGAP